MQGLHREQLQYINIYILMSCLIASPERILHEKSIC